jgi:hypothetical protein
VKTPTVAFKSRVQLLLASHLNLISTMTLTPLKERTDIATDTKLNGMYTQLGVFLQELEKKSPTPELATYINSCVEEINNSTLAGNGLRRLLRTKQGAVVKQAEKTMKLVPKNYYRNLWMMVGMSAFGVPLGAGFGAIMGNMGLLGLGLPIGMAIGLAVGSGMDKKALQEGRQLEVEFKH